MRFLALIAAGVLLACTPPKSPVPLDEKSYVVLLTIDEEGDGQMDGSCTAWTLGDDVWVSAGHCADMPAGAHWYAEGVELALVGFVNAEGNDADASLFRAHIPGHPALHLARSEPKPGAVVHYMGFPHAEYGAESGTWVGPVGKSDGNVFLALVYGGASGSPLLNSQGEVVGIVVASYRGVPYAYASSLANLRNLMDKSL